MWFDGIGHVWELKLMDCPTHELHEIKCPTNINNFTYVIYMKMTLDRHYSCPVIKALQSYVQLNFTFCDKTCIVAVTVL